MFLTTREKNLAEAKLKIGIFQGGSLIPLLFGIAMIKLSLGSKLPESRVKVNRVQKYAMAINKRERYKNKMT